MKSLLSSAVVLLMFSCTTPTHKTASIGTEQEYPNPFSPTTTITYIVPPPDSSKVVLILYNVDGVMVDTLVNEYKREGEQNYSFKGPTRTSIPGGIYFYRLTIRDTTITKKIVLLQ